MNVRLKACQWAVFRCPQRFRVLVAGRRFGKTYLSLVELCQAAWAPGRLVWYVGPTYKQAKRIAWGPLKQLTRPYWASPPSETDLSLTLLSGGTIALRGADRYDSLRGDGLNFVVLDEYASMAPQTWSEVLRPALADRQGGALFIGTPRGHNHFFDLSEAAHRQPDWAVFRFTTEEGGNVSRQELESATRELDERTYRQEFQASFENLTSGLVYYAFERAGNVQSVRYDPQQPLFWSLDFNVNPMCSIIGQRIGDQVHILDELVLPDSYTGAACEEFLSRTEPGSAVRRFPLQVYIYGDATGAGRMSAASRTDWQMVREFFGRYPDRYRATFRVPSTNPPVRDRVNCVNAVLRNQAGQRRLLVDPHCKQLILDFERVRWKVDPNGNSLSDLDKSDPQRSHLSDAVGYMIAREFSMRSQSVFRGERLL
jgi:hypothetical protein